MPLFDATFNWTPAARATGNRIYVDGAEIGSPASPPFVIELDLDFGTHVFELEPFNANGPVTRSTITREVVDTRPPAQVDDFGVSLSPKP